MTFGVFHKTLGRYQEALSCLDEALRIFRDAGLQDEERGVLAFSGGTLAALGRHEEALRTMTVALALSREQQDAYGELVCLVGQSHSHTRLGDPRTALRLLNAADDVARRLGTPDGEGRVHVGFAEALRALGELEAASKHAWLALGILDPGREPAATADVLNVLGAIHHDGKEHVQALRHHSQARQLAARVSYRAEQARALTGMAEALAAMGDAERAGQCRDRALAHYAEMGVPYPATAEPIVEAPGATGGQGRA